MILYSIIPDEIIFAGLFNGAESTWAEMDYMGEKVLVEPLENNQYRIQRLISTSPGAFLNPQLQPGNIIKGN